MREGWRHTTLGEIADVYGGGTPSTNTPEFWGGDIPWITPTEVVAQDGQAIARTKRTITRHGLERSGARLLPARSVLVTSRATVGAVALAASPIAINQGLAGLVCGNDVVPEWLMIWCQANRNEFRSRAGGSTFPEISRSIVRTIPLWVPSLLEQRRIWDLVAATDMAIQHTEKLTTRMRLVLRATADAVLLDEEASVVPLGSLAEVVMGQSPAGTTCNRESIGMALLNGPTEFGVRFPTPAQWTTSPTKVCNEGDILICVRGATAGRMNRADRTYCLGRGIAALRVSASPSETDLLHALLEATQLKLLRTAAGTIFPNISRANLEGHMIAWPSSARRMLVRDVIEAARVAAEAAGEQSFHLRGLRGALLDELLSGRTTIPDSYDGSLAPAS